MHSHLSRRAERHANDQELPAECRSLGSLAHLRGPPKARMSGRLGYVSAVRHLHNEATMARMRQQLLKL